MRLPHRLSAMALALAFGLLAAAPSARAEMGKPEWMKDDYWDYAFTGSFATEFLFDIQGPGTFRLTVLGPDTVDVGNATYTAYRARLNVNASGAIIFNSGERWFRTSDLALVKSVINVTVDTIFFGRITVLTTATYDPPLGMSWPLDATATWSAEGNLTTISQIIGNSPFPPIVDALNVQFTALSSSRITVAAGTFDTTPVREEDGSGGRKDRHWAPNAGNYARQEDHDSSDVQTYSAELRSYRYQAPGYFLGLPLVVWFLLILLIAIVVVVVVLRRRSRPRASMPVQYPPR